MMRSLHHSRDLSFRAPRRSRARDRSPHQLAAGRRSISNGGTMKQDTNPQNRTRSGKIESLGRLPIKEQEQWPNPRRRSPGQEPPRRTSPQRQREVLHVVTVALAVGFTALSSPSGQRAPAPAPPQVNPLVRPGAPGGRTGRGRGGGGPVVLRGVASDVGGPIHQKGACWSSSPAA